MGERKVQTIREAIAVALEGLSGDLHEWVCLAQQRNALRKHVKLFVHEFAQRRGVILEDKDITDELDAIVAALKSGRPLAEVARVE